jgi:hypothetical protein
MTRRLIAGSLVLAAGAVVLTAFAAAQQGDSGNTAAKPRLSVDLAPLAVAGTGFQPGESVRISVRGTAGGSRTVKASSAGRINMRFPGMRLDQCRPGGLIIVTAIGDKGSRAQFRRMPPACGIDPGRAP